MGFFRFRRSLKIIPGVRLNLGKRGASVSVGRKGFHYTIGPKNSRTTIGIPGTGLSYTQVHKRPTIPLSYPTATSKHVSGRSAKWWYTIGCVFILCGLISKLNPPLKDSLPSNNQSSQQDLAQPSSAPILAPLPTGPAAREAEKRALAAFPLLGDSNSALNHAFLAAVRKHRQSDPTVFSNPDWPSIIAKEANQQAQAPEIPSGGAPRN
jgi:hypothetical protein